MINGGTNTGLHSWKLVYYPDSTFPQLMEVSMKIGDDIISWHIHKDYATLTLARLIFTHLRRTLSITVTIPPEAA